jgi:uncharacterized SAM-binding protein YcdF (DUF218 family)
VSFFALSKVLTQLVYPLSIALLLLVAALVSLQRSRVRTARRFLVAAIALLWIASLPVVGYHVLDGLERRFPPVQPEATPSAGAIVLLGGAIAPPYPPRYWAELNGSADRIVHASRLWRAGKAPIVVSSGGGGPYTGGPQTPAEAMADLLVEWGVPRDAIVLERKSKTTYENALYSKQLLDERGIQDVLVVTSAAHMTRALAVFRSLGLHATAAPTDYETGGLIDYRNPTIWLPDASTLSGTASALKEYLGILVYWLRGWIHTDALRSVLAG